MPLAIICTKNRDGECVYYRYMSDGRAIYTRSIGRSSGFLYADAERIARQLSAISGGAVHNVVDYAPKKSRAQR